MSFAALAFKEIHGDEESVIGFSGSKRPGVV